MAGSSNMHSYRVMLSECIGRFAELVFPEEGIGITEEKK
jgi:hypothetical protein